MQEISILLLLLCPNRKFEVIGKIFIDYLCDKISERVDNDVNITNLANLDLREASEDEHYDNSQIVELSIF